jgi:sporulation protein YlmC with PRC-barrel domain
VRLSDLLGLPVRHESGERLGTVHDVRGELTPRTLRLTGLVVGPAGELERLGIRRARRRGGSVVAWSEIVRVDRRGVVVRDGES